MEFGKTHSHPHKNRHDDFKIRLRFLESGGTPDSKLLSFIPTNLL
jgi:hypothetical protein